MLWPLRRLTERYSPPAWGWSVLAERAPQYGSVFPTRVGMVRRRWRGAARRNGIPHPRGDGPGFDFIHRHHAMYSPPAWGWSALHCLQHLGAPVFPTRVGMVRHRRG